jgi:hypothetical protein
MDHAEPKTRKELKGGGKDKGTPYTQKRVRQMEALLERKGKVAGPQATSVPKSAASKKK